jgi:AraC family transcriptional regulator
VEVELVNRGPGEVTFDRFDYTVGLSRGGPAEIERHDDGKIEQSTLEPGELIVVPPGHYVMRWHDDLSLLVVRVDRTIMRQFAHERLHRDPDAFCLNYHQSTSDPLTASILEQLSELVDDDDVAPAYIESLVQALLAQLIYNYGYKRKVETPAELPPRDLARVRSYIDENLAETIRIADLAAICDLSEFHFSRLFKNTTGLSPYAYVVDARMRQAKERLRTTEDNVLDIALAVGYSSTAHFSTAFKKHNGMTPTAFRSEYR